MSRTFEEKFRAFDANKPETLPWATYAVYRNPEFKMHAKRAGALNCYSNFEDLIALYSWDVTESRWATVAEKDAEHEDYTCSVCGLTTIEHRVPHGFNYQHARMLDEDRFGKDQFDTGRYTWLRKGAKIVDPLTQLYTCRTCYLA